MFSVILLYFVYLSLNHWGKKFQYIGLNENFYRKFITIPQSKEEKCRIIFERLFNISFYKCRPNFLKNPKTNRNLELDGYNSSLITKLGKGLAFEYNGSQHYYYNTQFHKEEKDFEDQKDRDRLKRRLCEENNVMLITIPYNIDDDDLEDFIVKKIHEKELYHYL